MGAGRGADGLRLADDAGRAAQLGPVGDLLDADVPHGAGYYRHAHAPPVDPLEQSRSILQQAADAGAPFIACAEFVSELQWRAARHRCTRAHPTMIAMRTARGCTRTCT